ncbi:uncharacterized protein [Lepisosteus oculatus]|uniref:uncharacterized protein n=1 Tax=Lepisosteus oculatus TaxID=7918 RepID=UPI0035F5169A
MNLRRVCRMAASHCFLLSAICALCVATLPATSGLEAMHANAWYPGEINVTARGADVLVSFSLAPAEFNILQYVVFQGEVREGQSKPAKVQATRVLVSPLNITGQTVLHNLKPGRTYSIMVAADIEDAIRKAVSFTFPAATDENNVFVNGTKDNCTSLEGVLPWIVGSTGLLILLLILNTVFWALSYRRDQRWCCWGQGGPGTVSVLQA